MDKEKALVELYDLLDFFYENRDLPVDSDFDFYTQVKEKCDVLEVDYDTVVKEFNLKSLGKNS